jgi:hypothetical protein
VNVTLGEPRSSAKKAIAEAEEHSLYDGNYGFVVVPVNRTFGNGDHQFVAAWFDKPVFEKPNKEKSSKVDGTLN